MRIPTTLHRWKFLTMLGVGLALTLTFSHVYAAPSTDSMVLYWKMDENAADTCSGGEDFCDASGGTYHGTWSGSLAGDNTSPIWSNSTKPSLTFTNPYAFDFDGTDDHIIVPAQVVRDNSATGSIAMWVKTNQATTDQGLFSTVENRDRGMAINSSSTYGAFMYDGNGGVYRELSGGTVDTDWHHIVFTWIISEGELALYVDGTLVDSYSGSSWNDTVNGSKPTTIGSAYAASGVIPFAGYSHLVGYMDDIRMYSRVLSTDEITALAAGNHTTATWDGSSNNDYETTANWNINAVPDPYSHILLPARTRRSVLSAFASGASLTIEHDGAHSGTSLDLHGFNFELVDAGQLKGGGTLRLLGTETINASDIASASTGAVLYYGTGSYSQLSAGDSYYDLKINDGLVAYWDFNASVGGHFLDKSGYDNEGDRGTVPATPTFTTDTAPTAFYNNQALSFDGGDEAFTDAEIPIGTAARTFAFWAKTSDTSNSQYVASYGGGSGDAGGSFRIGFRDGKCQLDVSSGLSDWGCSVDTNWHHYAFLVPDMTAPTVNDVRVYQDGAEVAKEDDVTRAINTLNTTSLVLGRYHDSGSTYFTGILDDFRVYNRALQDHEISALAAGHMPATASGTFTLDANVAVANDLTLASGNLDVSGSNRTVYLSGSWLNYGGQFTPRVGSVRFEGAGESDQEIRSGGQEFYLVYLTDSSTWTLRDDLDATSSIRIQDSAGTLDASTNNYTILTPFINQSAGAITPRSGLVVLNATASKTVTITSALNELQIEDPTEDGLIAYWKFDECQTDTTADSSGNSQTGTLHGPALWTGSGLPAPIDFYNRCALSFDGSDDQFVESASNSTLTGNATFSIALWFYVPTGANTDGTYGRFIDWGNAASGESAQMSVYSSTINQLFVGHWATGQASTTTFSNDEWHHAVWVREGGSNNGHQGNTLYLDGVEIPLDINVSTAKTINVAADKYDIGGRGSGNLSVECMLDDVRVYDRILTPIEVRRLANGQYANGQLGTAQFSLGNNLDLDTLTILSGKVSASSRTIDVSGDWNNYAGSGAFIEGTSTVDFDGSSTQNIRGSTEFYDLEISTTSAQTVNFGSGTTQYISNSLTLAGAASNLLTLAPLTTGIEWFLNLAGAATQSVSYVSPSYSNASPGETISPSNSTDGGNNTNWSFSTTSSSGDGGRAGGDSTRNRITQSGGGGGGDVSYSDTESPTLADVGIADDVVEETVNLVGGILDASMRKSYVPEELSRRVLQVAKALTDRFAQGIYEYRIAQNEANEQLKASAPSTDDTERRMMRAEKKNIDNTLSRLTASAIGEKRGLLVAQVKSEEVVFADVPVDSWFAPYISLVIDSEIATGYEDDDGKPTGTFGVTNPVTYAEMLKMAMQAGDIDLSAGSPRNTSAQSTWASAYVAQAEDMSLDVFRTDLNVHNNATRGEVIHTLLQVLGLPIAPNATSVFSDLSDSHPYAKSIATAALYGLVSGDTDENGAPLGTVRPDDSINRAEVAKMIAVLQSLFE